MLSHLLGFEMMLHGAPVPDTTGRGPSHVRNPIGEINEAFVQAHRHEPGIEVLDRVPRRRAHAHSQRFAR